MPLMKSKINENFIVKLLFIALTYINLILLNSDYQLFLFLGFVLFSSLLIIDKKWSLNLLFFIVVPFLMQGLFPLLLIGQKKFYPLIVCYGILIFIQFPNQWAILLISLLLFFIDNLYQKLIIVRRENQILKEEKEKIQQSFNNLEEEIALEVSEKERVRMLQSLHDNVGHILTRSIFYVDFLKEEPNPEIIEKLEETLKEVHLSIRSSIYNTKENLSNLNILKELLKEKDPQISFKQYLLFSKLPKKIQGKIIKTIKEALTNMKKHSNGHQMKVLLFENEGFCTLIISDDGTNLKPFKEGVGLEGIKKRFANEGATVQFKNDTGFKILIEGIDCH